MHPNITPEFLAEQGFYHTIINRFWKHTHKNGDIPKHAPNLSACWTWDAYKSEGYGRINKGVRGAGGIRTHVLSYIIHFGKMPKNGQCVCHKCDNRECNNPEHLFLGTRKQNLEDMTRKGRRVRGETGGMAKLTEEKVIAIYQEYKRGEKTQRQIGKQFGISQTHVFQLVSGRNWKHVYHLYNTPVPARALTPPRTADIPLVQGLLY